MWQSSVKVGPAFARIYFTNKFLKIHFKYPADTLYL